EDYKVDQILALDILSNGDSSTNSTIKVKIRKLYTRTLSCVMLVDIIHQPSSGGLPQTAVLKLYGRHFTVDYRENRRLEPWGQILEEEYIEFAKTGQFQEFIHKIHQREGGEDDMYEPQDEDEWWDDGACEAALADELNADFNKETAMYDVMRDVQGVFIPKIFAHVEMDISPPGITPVLFFSVA
ncbi:hypothetical protein QBC38DRAFT_378478, partial [Podospora fimiseda]